MQCRHDLGLVLDRERRHARRRPCRDASVAVYASVTNAYVLLACYYDEHRDHLVQTTTWKVTSSNAVGVESTLYLQ